MNLLKFGNWYHKRSHGNLHAYKMERKSSVPFIVHKPDLRNLRCKVLYWNGELEGIRCFNYRNPLNIQSLKVNGNEDPGEGFIVKRNKDESVSYSMLLIKR